MTGFCFVFSFIHKAVEDNKVANLQHGPSNFYLSLKFNSVPRIQLSEKSPRRLGYFCEPWKHSEASKLMIIH